MFISKVRLVNYRNIENLQIDLSPKTNIIFGQNGQGKTNFTEAIYFQLRGSSFRFSNVNDLILHEATIGFIELTCISHNLEFQLKTSLQDNKKKQTCNGKHASASFLCENFPIILFSPESLSAIKEGPELRRALIDELLVLIYPKYADLLSEFKKALRTRNRILKDHQSGLTPKDDFRRLYDAINPSYLGLSIQVTEMRIKAIREISESFLSAAKGIFNRNVDISVEYVVSGVNLVPNSSSEIRNLIENRYHQLINAEISNGASLVGPHKHDVKFVYNKKDSRIYCSQGQQRALILAFKLAQIVYHRRIRGEPPVVILDDVLSEFDLERRMSLIRFLNEMSVQVLVTTADEVQTQMLLSGDYRKIEVREGKFFLTA